jgi:DNA-binding NarL/FixJ family response regulator
MTVRIAISDPLPIFRRGMMATLDDAGFHVEAPEDLGAWIRDEQRQVVFMTLQSPEDWTVLAGLRSRQDIIVVALLDDVNVTSHVRALTAGAVCAIARDALPDVVREVLEAAVHGRTLVPIEVLRALTSPEKVSSPPSDVPAPREIEWLQELARGSTVAQLADRSGYSERAMFRLLRELYTSMRVKNRIEALMEAHARGWV